MSFLNKINIINEKDKILDKILFIDVLIILILLFNFNFYLIIFDAILSSILILGIIIDIINNKNTITKNDIWLIFISLPYDLIIIVLMKFYPSFMIPSFISLIKYLRISKILKLIKTANFIMRYQQTRIEKIDRANKKIDANYFIGSIFIILLVCGIFLQYVENIKGLDIAYFILVTFSSVGYGDIVVSTTCGKIIAIIISLVSILGIGFLSALFLTYVNIDQEEETISLKEEVNELKVEINNLKEQNEELIKILKKN